MKPIPILATGTRFANNGVKYSFSQEDLEAIAASFNASKPKVPFVAGHASDEPGFGQPDELAVRDGVLHATQYQVNPVFRAIVNTGELSGVSVKVRTPSHPDNKTGTYELKHIAFLGRTEAADPSLVAAFSREAIDLAQPEEIEFSSFLDLNHRPTLAVPTEASMTTDIKTEAIAPVTTPAATPTEASPQMNELLEKLQALSGRLSVTEFAQFMETVKPSAPVSVPAPIPETPIVAPVDTSELDAMRLELDAANIALSDLRIKDAAFSRAQAVRPTMDKLVERGYGGEVAGLTAMFSAMADDQEIAFSSPAGEVKSSPAQLLKDFLERLPSRITLGGEVAGGEVAEFSKMSPAAVSKAIDEYRKKNPTASPSDALSALRKGGI